MVHYFSAYLIPVSAALGLFWGGVWGWLTVALVYVAIPLADQLRGVDPRSGDLAVRPQRGWLSRLNDFALYLALPVQWGLVFAFLIVWQGEGDGWARAGWIAAVGLSSGSLGITVAHELVHRKSRFAYVSGQILLLSVLYMQFAIEHVRGHHQHVGTDQDPASARRGQNVYAFVLESIWRQWGSAWTLEVARLSKQRSGLWTPRNEMLWIGALQALWLIGIGLIFGGETVAAYLAVAAVAVTLLEVVNYVEHYGLRRNVDDRGRLEPIRAHHSWNSDHVFSRALLFELPRHTDHHMNGGRPYPSLQSVSGAPQLPAGYPTMVLLALLPPLWFRVMDPKVYAVQRAR